MRILTFILLSILFLGVMASSASAVNNLPGIGTCDSSTLDLTKTRVFDNGCGAAEYICKLYVCNPRTSCFMSGYHWTFASCSTAKQNDICCGSLGSSPSCGYRSTSSQCGPCKACDGNGTCGNNLPDGRLCQDGGQSGYCGQGNCSIDNTPPFFINLPGNLYIKNMQGIKNATIDVDFIDNVKLREYTVIACDENSAQYYADKSAALPAPTFAGNCAIETFLLNNSRYDQNWKLSGEMWDWILEKIANQGKVSISVNLTDGVGLSNYSSPLFYIVNDYTKPSVSVSHSIKTVSGGNEVTITATAQDLLGETKTSIFIDGEQVGSDCAAASCSVSRIYAEGAHTYYAFVTDPSGNNATSETKAVSFIKTVPTCEESFGEICPAGKTCSQDVFRASDTNSCCAGSCNTEVVVLPTCGDQEGLAFNPSTDICKGNEVAAEGLASPLSCCVGTLGKVPQVDRLEVYWTNVNGEKISSASIQDNVKCLASGLIGTGKLTVTKNGEAITEKNVNLPSSSTFLIGETGTYVCGLEVGGSEKTATLRALELPAMPKTTSLPVFSAFNLISAVGLILVYYLILNISKTKKRK